jgi:multidrug efflux system outer membrane protein
MIRPVFRALLVAAAIALAGCASLAPPVPAPQPAIPAGWPLPATTVEAAAAAAQPASAATAPAAADIGWRDFFADPKLQALIERALGNNRDLRTAALNIERARALYRIQRADQFPTLGVNALASRRGGGDTPQTDTYNVALGIADFELDFFGRVRDLSRAALEQYFALEETRRAAQLSLIAELATVYLTLASDRAAMQLAQATLDVQETSFRLTQRRYELGAVSALDLHQARTTVESARADVARFAGQVARDTNAIALLVGAPVEPALLPSDFGATLTAIAPLPEGMPSEVLLRRPDVIAAEHRLRAANANIGAARAAFFPSITLTASAGFASANLSDLLGGGARFWAFAPQLNLPIFDMGRLQGNLEAARADQDIALAQYERAIQAGFRDVADALALTRTLAAQREAQQALVDAAARAYELSQARYEAGRDSFLVQLDAQRTLYAAQQGLIATRAAEQANRITLYKVLGGGWIEANRKEAAL